MWNVFVDKRWQSGREESRCLVLTVGPDQGCHSQRDAVEWALLIYPPHAHYALADGSDGFVVTEFHVEPVPGLHQAVDKAYDEAAASAAPFTPSHAQVAVHLQPVVEQLLALPRPEALAVLRTMRPGTWDIHVLAEVKSAWSLEGN